MIQLSYMKSIRDRKILKSCSPYQIHKHNGGIRCSLWILNFLHFFFQHIHLQNSMYNLQLSLTEYFCAVLPIYFHGLKSSLQDSRWLSGSFTSTWVFIIKKSFRLKGILNLSAVVNRFMCPYCNIVTLVKPLHL